MDQADNGSSSSEGHVIQGATSLMSRSYGSLNTDRHNDEAVTTFRDLGVSSPRRFKDCSKKDRLFLAVTGFTLLATLGFTILNLATINVKETDFIFAVAILLNILFCSFYLVHGVHRERPSEICILLIATASLVIFLIIKFALGVHTGLRLWRMIAAIVLGPFIVAVGVCVVRDYYVHAKLIFRTVGANGELQRCCQIMYIFLDLLKLDLQLGITLVILILMNGFNIKTQDIHIIIAVLSVGFTFSIAWFGCGYWLVRRESKNFTYIFWVLTVLEIGFACYKIWKGVDHLQENPVLAPCTLATAGLAVATDIGVLICTFFVYKNFGKGLKEKVYGRTNQSATLREL